MLPDTNLVHALRQVLGIPERRQVLAFTELATRGYAQCMQGCSQWGDSCSALCMEWGAGGSQRGPLPVPPPHTAEQVTPMPS